MAILKVRHGGTRMQGKNTTLRNPSLVLVTAKSVGLVQYDASTVRYIWGSCLSVSETDTEKDSSIKDPKF